MPNMLTSQPPVQVAVLLDSVGPDGTSHAVVTIDKVAIPGVWTAEVTQGLSGSRLSLTAPIRQLRDDGRMYTVFTQHGDREFALACSPRAELEAARSRVQAQRARLAVERPDAQVALAALDSAAASLRRAAQLVTDAAVGNPS